MLRLFVLLLALASLSYATVNHGYAKSHLAEMVYENAARNAALLRQFTDASKAAAAVKYVHPVNNIVKHVTPVRVAAHHPPAHAAVRNQHPIRASRSIVHVSPLNRRGRR